MEIDGIEVTPQTTILGILSACKPDNSERAVLSHRLEKLEEDPKASEGLHLLMIERSCSLQRHVETKPPRNTVYIRQTLALQALASALFLPDDSGKIVKGDLLVKLQKWLRDDPSGPMPADLKRYAIARMDRELSDFSSFNPDFAKSYGQPMQSFNDKDLETVFQFFPRYMEGAFRQLAGEYPSFRAVMQAPPETAEAENNARGNTTRVKPVAPCLPVTPRL